MTSFFRWKSLGPFVLPALAALLAPPARADDTIFPKGTYTLQTTLGGAYDGVENVSWAGTTVSVGKFFWDDVNLAIDVTGYAFEVQNADDPWGVAIGPTFRHFLIRRPDFTLYPEVGLQFCETSRNLPDDGTRFNFMLRFGVGTGFRLRDDLWLVAGLRYVHVSNGGYQGGDRHPGINAGEGFVGLMWQF